MAILDELQEATSTLKSMREEMASADAQRQSEVTAQAEAALGLDQASQELKTRRMSWTARCRPWRGPT
jgi:hypothetical protein